MKLSVRGLLDYRKLINGNQYRHIVRIQTPDGVQKFLIDAPRDKDVKEELCSMVHKAWEAIDNPPETESEGASDADTGTEGAEGANAPVEGTEPVEGTDTGTEPVEGTEPVDATEPVDEKEIS